MMIGTFGIRGENRGLPFVKPARSGGDQLAGRFVGAPEIRMERDWRIFAIDPLRRSVK